MRPNKFLYRIIFPVLIFSIIIIFSCSGNKNYLPDSILELKLARSVNGEEANKLVDKIHFNPVSSGKENEIGYYENEGHKSTIYLTFYKDENVAKTDFEKMTKKISPENSVFLHPAFIDFVGRRIYRCFGMGQTHFVFTDKNVLIWISTDTIAGREFLKSYLNHIE